MSAFESSIIIPVFNKWELTRKCLKSIAETTDSSRVEVIVVDNASSDTTERGCPFLGKQLFGGSFRYVRNKVNRNFAGACNQGAELAEGEFLIFLNNDTEVQPNWYQPLLDDFVHYDDIAATGPILVFPEETVLGRMVQHLGVYVNYYGVDHLYKGIPYASPLARKRRFFQIITAACLVVRKKLFVDVGEFDEKFINGFEDVDLCLRLSEKGYRMTVNPDSLVIHYEGQSQGRYDNNHDNSQYCFKKNVSRMHTDYAELLQNDNFMLKVTKWLGTYRAMPEETIAQLNSLLPSMSDEELKENFIVNPYWEDGLYEILKRSVDDRERKSLWKVYTKLFLEPSSIIRLTHIPWVEYDHNLLDECARKLRICLASPFHYLKRYMSEFKWCASHGIKKLTEQFAAICGEFNNFCENEYSDFARGLWRIECLLGLTHSPSKTADYLLWRYGVDNDVRKRELADFVRDFERNADDFPRISILMPVYNPKPEHLRGALDSVLAQTYPFWELCIADDASTDPETGKILSQYARKDSRIHVKTRDRNGRIAAATNTALAMATYPWAALMDHDDLLTDDALAFVARAILDHPNATLFFSDEDKFDGTDFYGPYFKNSKWDWELLPVQNFVCHLVTYRTDRLREINGFRDGFEGAQDHDLLMRYVGNKESENIVHIPHVLYHWREHEGSTSMGTHVKAYAFESAIRAGQSWLDKYASGSHIETLSEYPIINRVVYPLPSPLPSVSLICPIPASNFSVEKYDNIWRVKTTESFEMIYVCKEGDYGQITANLPSNFEKKKSRILVVPNEFSPVQRLQRGAEKASGDILGFIDWNLVPQKDTWLKEILSCLCRHNIGTVGGKLVTQNGTMIHGGYVADAGGGLKRLFAERKKNAIWFGWTKLARTVDAFDQICLFTKKEDFIEFDGFDASLGDWGAQDYCLRLGEKGKRSVWWPYAEFTHLDPSWCVFPVGVESFEKKWHDRIAPVHPDLLSLGALWNLYDRDAPPYFDFSSDEYLRLYSDLGRGKVNYVLHYLNMGIREGRKGRLSNIDYSSLTSERIARWKEADKNGVVVCTSLCGDYERLLPPAFLKDGWQYVCYSDIPRESWGIWDIRPIPYENDDLTRRSRWAKLNLPFLFPEAKWIFWLDANIVIGNDLSPLLQGKDGALFMRRHPMRTCVYEEGKTCIAAKKDSEDVLHRQIDAYKKAGMPANFGLWENNFFLVNPKAKEAKTIFARWWEEYCQYSRRDQISLPYVFYRNGYKPQHLFPDERNVHSWPAVYFLTHEETKWIDVPENIAQVKERS